LDGHPTVLTPDLNYGLSHLGMMHDERVACTPGPSPGCGRVNAAADG